MYFQKGFGLKSEVGPVLARTYQSAVVERLKALGYEAGAGGLHFKLAKEFGFCYGVDRAVDYAYQTRRQFPDRRVFLSGEIIHNPDVNRRIAGDGHPRSSTDSRDPVERFREVAAGDVVILPAFGVSVPELEHLKSKQCVLVDTTCGSVLNVWKKVHYYARDGYTVIIHGKHYHEETRATASQALTHAGGQYLCVRDLAETELVCDFIRGSIGAAELMSQFGEAASSDFDPERASAAHRPRQPDDDVDERDVEGAGDCCAARWSIATATADLESRFRAFDTICSATQERQDAVLEMLDAGGLDLMIVIGGYNSSNTQALARMCAPRVHDLLHRQPGVRRPRRASGTARSARTTKSLAAGWLPTGDVRIGITAGASTPDSVVGETIERILALRGRSGRRI